MRVSRTVIKDGILKVMTNANTLIPMNEYRYSNISAKS